MCPLPSLSLVHSTAPPLLLPMITSLRRPAGEVSLSSAGLYPSTMLACAVCQETRRSFDVPPLLARGHTFHREFCHDLHVRSATSADVEYPACLTRSASGAVNECARRAFDSYNYPGAVISCRTLWIEAADLGCPGPSAQLGPVMCAAGCCEEVLCREEISPFQSDCLFYSRYAVA